MWKTAGSPCKSRAGRPQQIVEEISVFHRGVLEEKGKILSTEKFSFFHGCLWINFGSRKKPVRLSYREELMLAVMSRTVAWRGEVGDFRLISTLRMEWSTVE